MDAQPTDAAQVGCASMLHPPYTSGRYYPFSRPIWQIRLDTHFFAQAVTPMTFLQRSPYLTDIKKAHWMGQPTAQDRQTRRFPMLLAKRSVRSLLRFQPAIEILEGRSLMSAGITIVGHEMDITAGTPGSTISVTDNGAGAVSAWMKTGSQTISQVGQGISKVVIHGGDGNDIIYFQDSGVLKSALELDIDTGAGSDHEYLNFQRGISGAPVALNLAAGSGADSVDLSFGNIQNSKVNVKANLHSSSDIFSSVVFYGLSGNSMLNYNIQGNGMADRVVLNFMGDSE
jgi:hypothetical protein